MNSCEIFLREVFNRKNISPPKKIYIIEIKVEKNSLLALKCCKNYSE